MNTNTGSNPVLTTAHSEPSMAFLKSNIGGTIKVVTAWKDKQCCSLEKGLDSNES